MIERKWPSLAAIRHASARWRQQAKQLRQPFLAVQLSAREVAEGLTTAVKCLIDECSAYHTLLAPGEWLWVMRDMRIFDKPDQKSRTYRTNYVLPLATSLCALSAAKPTIPRAKFEEGLREVQVTMGAINLWAAAEEISECIRLISNARLDGVVDHSDDPADPMASSPRLTYHFMEPPVRHGLAPVHMLGQNVNRFPLYSLVSLGTAEDYIYWKALYSARLLDCAFRLVEHHGLDIISPGLCSGLCIRRPWSSVLALNQLLIALFRENSEHLRDIVQSAAMWPGTGEFYERIKGCGVTIAGRLQGLVPPSEMEKAASGGEYVADLERVFGLDEWPMRHPVAYRGVDYVAVDLFAASSALMSGPKELAIDDKSSGDRAKIFEGQVQFLIERYGLAPRVGNLVGKKLRHSGRELTDLDAVFEVKNKLVIISCKSIVIKGGVLANERASWRNLTERVKEHVEEWDKKVAFVNANRVGDNYDFREWETVLGFVVTPADIINARSRGRLSQRVELPPVIGVCRFAQMLAALRTDMGITTPLLEMSHRTTA